MSIKNKTGYIPFILFAGFFGFVAYTIWKQRKIAKENLNIAQST